MATQCEICGKQYKNETGLTIHKFRIHGLLKDGTPAPPKKKKPKDYKSKLPVTGPDLPSVIVLEVPVAVGENRCVLETHVKVVASGLRVVG
jgi:hypothetical protein